MNKSKKTIIIISISLAFSLLVLCAILLYNKYDEVGILSLDKEYNYVLSKDEAISIPLYFEKNSSFLTDLNQIEKVSMSSENIQLSTQINSIVRGNKTKYQDRVFYEYIFSISFPSYSDFLEPLFLQDAIFTIAYKNGNEVKLKVGNWSMLFRNNEENLDLSLLSLSPVINKVNQMETLVGINLGIVNNKENIVIEKISTKNANYEFDYHNLLNEVIETKSNLNDVYPSYHYVVNSLDTSIISKSLNKETTLFIPLKYLDKLKYLDRLPIFIEYKINEEKKTFIIDDFLFISNGLINTNAINYYEYNYYSSK